MRIVFLGTGCPIVSAKRYGAAQVVCHGSTRILIDCGSGVTQRLKAAGVSGCDLDAVLLTHLHFDHAPSRHAGSAAARSLRPQACRRRRLFEVAFMPCERSEEADHDPRAGRAPPAAWQSTAL